MQETVREVVEFEQAGRVFLDGGDVIIVGTPKYFEIADKKLLEYRMKKSSMGINELHGCTKERSPEDPVDHVKEEDLTPEEKEAFDKVANEEIDVMVIHKETLDFAGKKIKVKHIPAFAEAVIKSFMDRYPEKVVETNKDFMVVRVNFETRNISIQAIK